MPNVKKYLHFFVVCARCHMSTHLGTICGAVWSSSVCQTTSLPSQHVEKFLRTQGNRLLLFENTLASTFVCSKWGVTANPAQRFEQYLHLNFTAMWVIFKSGDLSLVHMLEASLIALFSDCNGCRNSPNTGGEGALNRRSHANPPFFVYVVGGRADQLKKVG